MLFNKYALVSMHPTILAYETLEFDQYGHFIQPWWIWPIWVLAKMDVILQNGVTT